MCHAVSTGRKPGTQNPRASHRMLGALFDASARRTRVGFIRDERGANDGDGGIRRDGGDDDDKVVIHGGEYAAHGVVYGDVLSRYAGRDGRFASRMSRGASRRTDALNGVMRARRDI